MNTLDGCGRRTRSQEDRAAALVVGLALAFVLALPLLGPLIPGVDAPPHAGTLQDAAVNPAITSCAYLPDPNSTQRYRCSDSRSAPNAYTDEAVRLNLTVAGPNGLPVGVAIYWDAYVGPSGPRPANASAVQYFSVPVAPPTYSATLETSWIYSALSANRTGNSSYYFVYVNVSDSSGYDPYSPTGCLRPYGNCLLNITVARNMPPDLDGLPGVFTKKVLFPDPVIPPFVAEVAVVDNDNDPVTVTWVWGDGTLTVNRTTSTWPRAYLTVVHAYSFPLNATPRDFYFYLNVTVDDGLPGHNVTMPTVLIFYWLGLDMWPLLRFESPNVGSPWEIGAAVPIAANVSDWEGDPLVYYWDYGDGNVTSSAAAANGTVRSTHAYSREGPYNITIWATDGLNKVLCMNQTTCSPSRSHWVNLSQPIEVHPNRAPFVSVTVSSSWNAYGKPTTLTTAVLDQDWDNLTVTWSFGDGTFALNRTQGGPAAAKGFALTQVHTYAALGPAPNYTYTVEVWVDDGRGHNVSAETDVFVGSTNLPPTAVVRPLLANNTARANEQFTLEVNVSDPEGDPVNVTVDFGDGTVQTFYLELEPGVNRTLRVNHAYAGIWTYTINVTVTDGLVYLQQNRTGGLVRMNHTCEVSTIIAVSAPRRGAGSDAWTWWDYTALAAVLSLPAVLTVRGIRRRIAERRQET